MLDLTADGDRRATSWPGRTWPTGPATRSTSTATAPRPATIAERRWHARDVPVVRPQRRSTRPVGGRGLTHDRRRGRPVHRLRAGHDVRALRPDPRRSRPTRALMGIPTCIGAKHSSLSRELEWERLVLRDRGAPRLHGVHRQRPRHRHGDVRQRLPARAVHVRPRRRSPRATGCGRPATRRSTSSTTCSSTSASSPSALRCPGYRHDAAIFSGCGAGPSSDGTPPPAPRRPDSDRAVLADILDAELADADFDRECAIDAGEEARHASRPSASARGAGRGHPGRRPVDATGPLAAAGDDPRRAGGELTVAQPVRDPAHGGLGRHDRRPAHRPGAAPLAPLRPRGAASCGARRPRSAPTAGPTPTSW